MNSATVSAALAATILTALSGAAFAQFPPPPPPAAMSPAPVQERWPDQPKSAQGQAQAQAPASPARIRTPASPSREEPLQPAGRKPAAAGGPNVVACSGVFAKDSTHLKLAIKYDSRNVTYDQVDGPDGSRIPGTVLFPNDPRRRLEVLWANDASRSDTSVIAINGKSQWSGPKGLKLGLSLAALEKANGRPFKISGFGADGIAGVAGWEDGALNSLPGGCKVGMRLAADPKASPDARSAVAGDKEYLSNDASVRALKPTIVEILIGY